MTIRRGILSEAREQLEPILWHVVEELNETLKVLSKVPNFDPMSDGAVGSVVHASLQTACETVGIEDADIRVERHENGPAYKLVGKVRIFGKARDFSLELHIAGPRGGTWKGGHQFAPDDPEMDPLFEEAEIPETLLFFMAYVLSPARTKIERIFLVFADNCGKERIELRQIESVASKPPDVGDEAPHVGAPIGLKLKSKRRDAGDAKRQDKRGDAAPGA